MDISAWLRELGLDCYEQAFRENQIDARSLPHLTPDDLKEMGVTAIGHRRVLLRAIANLGKSGSPAVERASERSTSREGVRDAPKRASEAERRQLTVMFVDLVGSTALAGQLDPEDMGVVIRRYQECCGEVISRWDGHVAKYMGDGVLAYFGWPQAHEDDAERAVRAGLDLANEVGRLTATDGTPLGARVGIATGLVMVGDLVGEGAAQEQRVIGETPNLAARLQGVAEPGSIVISEDTRRLSGGLFKYADLGWSELKGFGKPVRAWQVLGESEAESRFEALHGQQLTVLVGRGHEIGLLVDRWERVKEGEGQVVLLSGEPGIGKSRIVCALRERLADEPHTPLPHYCSPHHTNSALYPAIGLLERAAGFTRNEAAEARLDKLESLLARGTEALGEAVPLVAALLGIETGERYPAPALSPQRHKQRTLEVLVEQVEGLAARQPVLAVYEDVHWVDPTTLEALDLLIERVQRLPVLVLITFRPEFSPPWTGHAHVLQLSLSRLTRRHGQALVAAVTGDKALPNEVLDQILAKTDGVPLFVEELTKTVLESGLLKDQGDRYDLEGPLPPFAIPSSLQDSLMARLDRLAPAKEVAQIGAVIGREFAHELVAAVSLLSEADLNAALDQLVASELVFRRGVPPAATYSFKHALVQDTAYQSLLKSRRQQLHARIAETLEQRFAATPLSEPEVLAHHYTEAGLAPQAISCCLKAGRKAAERSADREAAAQLTKGLELVEQLPHPLEQAAQELDLRIALGPVLMNLKGPAAPEVGAVYQRAQELCREVGRPEKTFPVLWGLWFHCHTSGQLRVAEKLANELIAVAEQLPETIFRLQAHHAAWTTRSTIGEFVLALKHVEQGLGIYDLEQHASSAFVYAGHDAGVCGRSSGALISWVLGYPDRALHLAEEGEVTARRLSHPFSSAQALCFKAILHQLRSETESVDRYADELLAHCAEHDLKIWSYNGQMLKGWSLLRQAQVDEGRRRFRDALDERGATRVTHRQAYYLAILADALGLAGQPEEALDAIGQALELINSAEDRRWEALAHRVRGDLLFTPPCRDEAAAEEALQRAVEVARGQEAKSLELRAATSLARLLVARDERQKAHDLLASIYSWFTEGFDTADLKEAEALLAELA